MNDEMQGLASRLKEISEGKTEDGVRQTLVNTASIIRSTSAADAERAFKAGNIERGFHFLGEILVDLATGMGNIGRQDLYDKFMRIKREINRMGSER